jgi:hypothetical protein
MMHAEKESIAIAFHSFSRALGNWAISLWSLKLYLGIWVIYLYFCFDWNLKLNSLWVTTRVTTKSMAHGHKPLIHYTSLCQKVPLVYLIDSREVQSRFYLTDFNYLLKRKPLIDHKLGNKIDKIIKWRVRTPQFHFLLFFTWSNIRSLQRYGDALSQLLFVLLYNKVTSPN